MGEHMQRRFGRGKLGQAPFTAPTSPAHRGFRTLGVISLGAVLLAAAVGCGGSADTAPAAGRAPVPVRVAPVTRGPIAATLAYSGEVQATDQVDLIPSAAGRLTDLFVDEGQEVRAGTEIARLETDTLEAQVRQAGANVQTAQARLETILQGARPEEIAAAKALLEVQQARLQGMTNGGRIEDINSAAASVASTHAKFADIQAGTKAADIAAAQAAVDTAAANLNSGQAKLSLLLNPTELDILSAQASLDSARASLESAEAKLVDLKATPKAADVAAAQAAVAAAEATLRTSESSLADVRQPLNKEKLQKLIDAYAAVSIANEKYDLDKSQKASSEVLRADETAVNQAYRALDLARIDANTFSAGVTTEKLTATIAAVASARAKLESERARLKQILDGPTEADMQAAAAAVDNARANVQAAQTRVARLKSPTQADLATAQAAVATAQASLSSSQAKLDQLKAGATAAELEAARAAVAGAEATLARTKTPNTDTDIGAQAASVSQAQQQYLLTQSRYTQPDINSAAAAVAQAQAALDLTRIQLSRGSLYAPFDAVVARKYLSKGAQVSAQTPVINLVSKNVQVVFNVEEAAIGRLKENQQVTFQVTAFGTRNFRGRISSIAPTADSASRTFRLKVAPDANQDGLRAGMFANVTVAVESRNNVLLAPQEAVVQRGAESFVYVVKGDQSEQRKVELGLRNDKSAEVRSGVEEGEQVVTRGNRTLQPDDKGLSPKVTVVQQ